MPGFFHLASICIYVLILYGYINRRKLELHVKVMRLAFFLELLLVLIIEISRGAIEQAIGIHEKRSGFPDGILGFHIIVSIIALLLFIATFFIGSKLYKGNKALKQLHIKFGYSFLLFRTLNLITSFMII
jgi:uncharacterized membrane protein YozB (DUF420 family)